MEQKLIEKAIEIISAKNLDCVLSLIDSQGYPTASTVTVIKNDRINVLCFCTMLNCNRAKRAINCIRASVCFLSREPLYSITLVGKIEVLTDFETKKDLWQEGMEDYFYPPYRFTGYEDDNYCVMRFKTERYKIFIDCEEFEGEI